MGTGALKKMNYFYLQWRTIAKMLSCTKSASIVANAE